jgi:polygalacturonase
VLVENCVVYHAHGGFTIGSEMSGGVRNVRVTNCLFMGTDIGLRFKSTRGRGGAVEKISISDVRMQDLTSDAINFNMFYGGSAPGEETGGSSKPAAVPVTEATPRFQDISIEHVLCRGARSAIVLEGLPEMPIRNISLKDVSITANTGVSVIDADGITFEGVRVEAKTEPKLVQKRVSNSRLALE